ncbi:hypothetical protein CTAYLR_007649 [Chrysophaeum taylorii]|uniref:Protein yippee-like n=1 Tax=Chrysophaeum taylorii TaxID=2483200 RepID=A0AAD7U546_9STRA|nr:hypothetical protein CTAYLR_007649 [Chrysophaeum taylorii]
MMSSIPERPLVFQCRLCRTIVADSLTIEAISEARRTVSLREAAAVVRAADVVEDADSTFRPLRCASCSAAIGRTYLTTPLEDLRDLYTLDIDALASYELGTTTAAAPMMVPAPPGGGGVDRLEATLIAEIRKVQAVALQLDDRLEDLEKRHRKLAQRRRQPTTTT